MSSMAAEPAQVETVGSVVILRCLAIRDSVPMPDNPNQNAAGTGTVLNRKLSIVRSPPPRLSPRERRDSFPYAITAGSDIEKPERTNVEASACRAYEYIVVA